jgi:3-hydroxybutyryl-CoA dehydratase
MPLQPGDTFRHVRRCDPYRPLYYAAASGDFNPLHIDREVARRAGFPDAILHGMCTYGWLAEACTTAAGDPGALTLLRSRFSRPVFPGDEITFDGRVVGVTDGIAALEVRAVNQRGEEVLKDARAEVRAGALAPPSSNRTESGAFDAGVAQAGEKTYGPYTYEAGVESIRDYALALSGAIPTRVTFATPTGPWPHPWHVDEEAARSSPYGAILAPPTFAAVYAMQPFPAIATDPANGIDLLRMLHGEQELRFHEVVRAGDRLTTTGGIRSRARKASSELVVIGTRTVNGRGELVTEGLWTAVLR